MNGGTVINLGYASVLLAFAFLIWRVWRDPRPKARDVIAAARHDVGPDNLRLLEDLDAHLDAYAAQIAGLYEPLVSPDPVLAAGADRLWDAIRDEQRGEVS
jgi:hypothetical protein